MVMATFFWEVGSVGAFSRNAATLVGRTCSMKWCSNLNGWEKPLDPSLAHADAMCFANATICSRRIVKGDESGHAHWTATGVSP